MFRNSLWVFFTSNIHFTKRIPNCSVTYVYTHHSKNSTTKRIVCRKNVSLKLAFLKNCSYIQKPVIFILQNIIHFVHKYNTNISHREKLCESFNWNAVTVKTFHFNATSETQNIPIYLISTSRSDIRKKFRSSNFWSRCNSHTAFRNIPLYHSVLW